MWMSDAVPERHFPCTGQNTENAFQYAHDVNHVIGLHSNRFGTER